MHINKNSDLVLKELYEYDIHACVYMLLQNIGWDLSDIPYEDKKQRNIEIGLLQRDNPKLARYLLDSTLSIIKHYLRSNSVTDDELIVWQRDGIITKKLLRDTTSTLPLEYISNILVMIISVDRKWFLLLKDDGSVSVKGVPNKPIDTSFYNMFRNINYGNKKTLAKDIERMRLSLFASKKVEWFSFEKGDTCQVPIKGLGNMSISKAALSRIDPTEVYKQPIWDNYIWPFCQSLLLYCE